MKQIFDWLREQIEEKSVEVNNVAVVSLHNAIVSVNRAQLKWEADCCEWSPMKYLEFSLSDCLTSCGHAEHYSTGIDKYCRHCGKPIKISEVE